MAETILGKVEEIIDRTSFKVKVRKFGRLNNNKFEDTETIKILHIYCREWAGPPGDLDRETLKIILKGKDVRCYVWSRDKSGRIEADVVVL